MATLTSQQTFLMQGGVYQAALTKMEREGVIDSVYEYREYPKAVRINHRVEHIVEEVEDIRGKTLRKEFDRNVWDEVIVNNEDEEKRVLGGGPSAAQEEDEREMLYTRAEQAGVKIDKRWSTPRIKAEMSGA